MLTEDERRRLDEIELGLRRTDPRLAARLTGTRTARLHLWLVSWRAPAEVAGLVVGAVLVVTCFATAPAAAVAGVGLMLAAACGMAPRLGAWGAGLAGRGLAWWRDIGPPPGGASGISGA